MQSHQLEEKRIQYLRNNSQQPKGRLYTTYKKRSFISKIHVDLPLLILLLIIATFGTWLLHSAGGGSMALTNRHITNYVIGFTCMISLAQMGSVQFNRYADKLYILSLVLLCIVLFSASTKGSSRWINLYFINIQPSELIKIVLPLFIAAVTSRYVLPLSLRTIGISTLAIILPAILIYNQPDLGTTIIVVLSGVAILFFAGLSWKIILVVITAMVAVMPIVWQLLLKPYQKKRVLTLLQPENDPFGSGWNISQSKIAIGSGGIEGKGWMQGTQAQLDFLPESHTDFIFAVIAEETGFIGVLCLLSLYLLVILRCCYIAITSHTLFDRLLVSGLTVVFFIYVFTNIGMTLGLLPVVGVPLPLVSYGGSSVVSLLAGFGMIMAVHARHNRQITKTE